MYNKYVGQTNDPVRRLREHISDAKGGKSIKDKWIINLLSHGKKPMIKIIDEANEQNIDHLEKYYIKYFSKNYKLTNSQDGGLQFRFTNKENIIKANRINSILYRKPVLQYGLDGKFIKEYNSLIEAAASLSIKRCVKNIKAKISANCNNHRKSAYGFIWKFKINNKIKNIEPYCNNSANHSKVKINKLSKNGKILCTYNSCVEAAIDVTNNKSSYRNIFSCIHGKQKTAYGFKWEYA